MLQNLDADDDEDGPPDRTFEAGSTCMRASLCNFLDQSRLTATLAEQPQRLSLAGSALSDESSGDFAINATFSHFGIADGNTAPSKADAQAGMDKAEAHADEPMGNTREAEAGDAEVLDAEEIPPEMPTVTELARVPPGQELNPVFKWHNDYVAARHKGRLQLQVRARLVYARVCSCLHIIVCFMPRYRRDHMRPIHFDITTTSSSG